MTQKNVADNRLKEMLELNGKILTQLEEILKRASIWISNRDIDTLTNLYEGLKLVSGGHEVTRVISGRVYWESFYHKYFNLNLVLSDVNWPIPDSNYWDLFIPQFLTYKDLFKAFNNLFQVKINNDFLSGPSEEIGKKLFDSFREYSTYILRTPISIKPDFDCHQLGLNHTIETHSDCTFMTLRERMLLELYYFDTHKGRHLDHFPNGTVCTTFLSPTCWAICTVARWDSTDDKKGHFCINTIDSSETKYNHWFPRTVKVLSCTKPKK